MKSLFTFLMILSLLSAASQAPCQLQIPRHTWERPSIQLEWEPIYAPPPRLPPGFLLPAPLF